MSCVFSHMLLHKPYMFNLMIKFLDIETKSSLLPSLQAYFEEQLHLGIAQEM